MASSESQGKTIALVVFVVLWFGSSVAAYVFWQKWDAAFQEADKQQKAAAQAGSELSKSKANFTSLAEKMIFDKDKLAPEALIAKIDTELKPDMPKNPPSNIAKALEPVTNYPNYQAALKTTHDLLREFSDQIAKLDKDKKELEEQLKSARAQYSAENKKFQDLAAAAAKDKLTEVANFEGVVKEKSVDIENTQRRLSATMSQLAQASLDNKRSTDKLTQENRELRDNLTNVRRQEDQKSQIKFQHVDGKVVELTDGGRSTVIDIGYAEGLLTGLTFGIYGRDRGGNPNELPKAACEIVRIIDDHRSVAKLSLEQLNNPVLPGDLLYNPVWSPGDKQGIAFVGVIHLGRGNEDESDAFKKLVEANGGKIDSYMDLATGQVKGNINVKTQWLVIGDIPEPDEKTSDTYDKSKTELFSKLSKASSTMREAAKSNGVRIISLRNFLTYMGHNNPERTIPGGREDLLYKKGPPRLEKEDDSRPPPRKSAESKAPAKAKSGM